MVEIPGENVVSSMIVLVIVAAGKTLVWITVDAKTVGLEASREQAEVSISGLKLVSGAGIITGADAWRARSGAVLNPRKVVVDVVVMVIVSVNDCVVIALFPVKTVTVAVGGTVIVFV